MTRTMWIDARAGASGDMLIGALLDAGAPLEAVQHAIDAIGTEPIRISTERVRRSGFAAVRAHVEVASGPRDRTWRDVRVPCSRPRALDDVRTDASPCSPRSSTAEGWRIGVAADDVRLHAVGALDAIADVVGCCAARRALGADQVVVSPVALGRGWISGAHGRTPVPGPAVVALLAAAAAPSFAGEAPWEACTPTGAALLATWATRWGLQPALTVSGVGAGAGGRGADDDPALQGAAAGVPANILRLVVGDAVDDRPAAAAPASSSTAVVVETNVDDLDPRLWPRVVQRLLDAGAGDAWLTPIVMKKGRAAHTLHVIASQAVLDAVVRVVLTETSAIGVRLTPVGKRALAREVVPVDVDGHPVRVKVARLEGAVVNASAELDDVLALADALGVPAKVALARATAALVREGLGP
jgi:hypothetical protein